MTVSPLVILTTMTKAGLFTPGLPHRQVRQLLTLRTWRLGLAGELRQAASRSPKAVAVIDEAKGPTTYEALLARSEKVSALLLARGYGPGQRIGLLARNHVGAIEAMVGVSAIGADVVLLNTGVSAAQLAQVAEQQELVCLIHDEEFVGIVSTVADSVARIGEADLEAELRAMPQPEPLRPPATNGRTIILTSGTTGTPKGAARKTPGAVSYTHLTLPTKRIV